MLFYIFNDVEYDEETDDLVEKRRFEECKKVKGLWIDRRTIDDPSKFYHKKDRENWYCDGKNHRVVNGMIERDFNMKGYVIEINTLEDVLNFQNKYQINAMPSNDKSNFVYNGKELNIFHVDFMME